MQYQHFKMAGISFLVDGKTLYLTTSKIFETMYKSNGKIGSTEAPEYDYLSSYIYRTLTVIGLASFYIHFVEL